MENPFRRHNEEGKTREQQIAELEALETRTPEQEEELNKLVEEQKQQVAGSLF